MTHIVEQEILYEEVLGTVASDEAFYDAIFSKLPWFPAYVIDKARRFKAFKVGYPLPECSYFYKNINDSVTGQIRAWTVTTGKVVI